LITGHLFLCLVPFLWDKVSDPTAGPLLSVCYDSLLIIFKFCSSLCLWICSLAQEMSFVDCYLPFFRQWLITHPLSALVLFQPLLKVSMEISSLLLPLLWCAISNSALLLCVSFQSFVYCSVFCFVRGGVSLPRGLCWFIPAVARGIPCDAWCSPVWSAKCLPSRETLPVSGSATALLFSQCNVAWRNLPLARGSGC
jgi:hypothetical protein